MFELVKLMWNVYVLHDSIEKGDMTAGTWAAALLFLAVAFLIALPAMIYYDRHPEAPFFFMEVTLAGLALLLLIYFILGIRWWVKVGRARQQS